MTMSPSVRFAKLISSIACRMTSSKVSKEKLKFDSVVTYLHGAIGVERETVSQVLEDLLEVYDYNWEYIEADDFRVLTDAIFDKPDPKVQSDHFLLIFS